MATSFAFQEVKALVRRPQRAQAQQLLGRLAAAVLPILTRRRFRVRRLLEFFPKDGALLGMNVNRGAKIYVRLRPARDPESFYPYEALLEALLHELTHMVHGPHNQAFYKYLDELKQEMEALMVRGLVGQEGVKFADAGEGQRLGGSSAGVPIRVAAVLAAKRREQYHSLLGGETSRRLGSTTSGEEVLDPQALRHKVLEAAERRRRDNEHCRNVLHEGASHEILGIDSSDEDEAEDNSANIRAASGNRQTVSSSSATEVIVLDQDDDGLAVNRAAAIINLIEEEENNADRPRQCSSDDGALMERGRKRKRQEGSPDIIDLT